jgi:UDP-glucose 4-epimerase
MKALVAGGAGFIGSHIAERLATAGHEVTVLDGLLERTGGRREHIGELPASVRFVEMRVARESQLAELLADCDVVVDAMGWTCHRLAMADPFYDIALNIEAHVALLAALPKNPALFFLYLGSRGHYGNPAAARIDEDTPLVPEDVQGIDKVAAESYVRLFAKLKGFTAASLRFANCFGPRQPVHGDDIGLVGVFLRDLLAGREIELYGRGRNRPLAYVGDLAEIAVALCTRHPAGGFHAFNYAGHQLALEDFIAALIRATGGGSFTVQDFPDEIRAIDTGNAEFCDAKLRAFLGGLPQTPLDTALAATVNHFRKQLA